MRRALPRQLSAGLSARRPSLLTLLEPHLLIKGEPARIALALHATKTQRIFRLGVTPDVLLLPDELHQQIHALNQRTALRQALADVDQDA